MDREHLEANRLAWDERVPIHLPSTLYDVEGFLAGGSKLRPFERDELGPVAGRSMVHLQCHFGLDTLSWAREGARVTGLDFSEPAIIAARDLAAKAGLDARFVIGDVLDAATTLEERFDIVYTGLGALCWIDDLERWASQVRDLLVPGGTLYLVEFHPFTDVFADDRLEVAAPYFDDGRPYRDESSGTYTDRHAGTTHNVTYSWTHPISEVIGRLLDAGLHLDRFEEHDFTLFQRFPSLTPDAGTDHFRFPPDHPRLPLMYSLRASLPTRR